MDISLAGPSVRAGRRPLVVAELRDSPLSVDECLAAVSLPEAGGTALFVGTVRDHDGGRSVVELEYVAHPVAEREMAAVAREVAEHGGVWPEAGGAPGGGPRAVGVDTRDHDAGGHDHGGHDHGGHDHGVQGHDFHGHGVQGHDVEGHDVEGHGLGAVPGLGAPAGRGVLAVAVLHRTGLLTIGDIAVVAAASAAHRAEAFVACRALIDEVKSRVPIWKRQLFSDGTAEWVGACSAGNLG
ncbi:molybdenum cofactor biosynthesis protein MoaE [Frankia sp. CNm7]|uniref:Molybdenum cofactor biosynthesis protein MoaE n=1 Tax=Frankia nepalensis TaxID=1836974 RepID=A0A937RQQ3_9ACTN|nr:molybdenum cofactor biosynthesis protein MoaE [Frankia nepalensis]MBL7511753.1 molybdenum cofactor biosynthesis protein MoaE [Frankia nepalensis]MBL7524336.1 molybdenum cofactor biosynthesis protein MoaE [Frankia nepalensis]MBL7633169.1 molybdenum cofactor biosynthesis protein MoaE [Frankia nepalensis]